MITDKLSYLVVENAPDVCEGIIRRMNAFEKWQSIGYCMGVKEALEKITASKPQLIYLDWSLNGGSAFEVLQLIQNMAHYNPYIIFNTGFQKDNPEIPQEIINHYKVDKYLVKPLWENLRNNLPVYLEEAAEKVTQQAAKGKSIWMEDNDGIKIQLALDKLICICQHPVEPRCRIFYFHHNTSAVNLPMQWHRCFELLQSYDINYFVTKSRSHLVVKNYIESFEKPFVRLKNFPAKVEVVKENLKEFEQWLVKE